MTTSKWASLADQVAEFERQGMNLSADWYLFKPIRREDAEQLLQIQNDSLSTLNTLAFELDWLLKEDKSGSHQEEARYAYQLAQELIQSRTATLELLHDMVINPDNCHPEFGRALALKERAAVEQAGKLRNTVDRIQ